MPDDSQEMQTIVLKLKAFTDEQLAKQLVIVQDLLDHTSFEDITCTHYIKEKRGFRCCARITARAAIPDYLQFASELATLSWGPIDDLPAACCLPTFHSIYIR
jgi:hypothetical protein